MLTVITKLIDYAFGKNKDYVRGWMLEPGKCICNSAEIANGAQRGEP